MASSRVLGREVQDESSLSATANPHKHSVLIIIGRTARLGQTEHIRREIERGVRSWDVDLKSCNLSLHFQEFLSHHTASFKGAGQTCLRHSTRVLDTQVLISPSQDQVQSEVFALLSRDSSRKLLILAGQSVEESGDLLFHQGLFSAKQLKHILTKTFIDQDNSAFSKLSLTVSCPNIGHWRTTVLGDEADRGPITLHINPPEVLPAMAALGEFTSLISGTLGPSSPFELLPPPTTVGFLKLSRPCCYVFPAGRGDCAFFAVNGFTMLVDGGSDTQACFWKLVRHLDRVDAVLLTHIGTENLSGVNTFLERKVAELELGSDVKEDSSKRLISPELGVVFFNAPSRLQMEQQPNVDNVLKSSHQAALTLQLLKKLDIKPQPMFRPQVVPIEPVTLFQKMGVGQLDLYILSPGKNSQEYQTFMQNWPDGVTAACKSQTLPLTALTSVSALLVWHPACPQEKVVRVLFPGVTPQAKLLQGLEKLKNLTFLQKPTVTTGDLERLGEDRRAKRTDSQDSSRSPGKETKHGKEAKEVKVKEKGKAVNGADVDKNKTKEKPGKQKGGLSDKNTLKKGNGKDGKKEGKSTNREENGPGKKEALPSKPKNENKSKLRKEEKNDSGVKRTKKTSGKEANDAKKAHVKAESAIRNAAKPNNMTAVKTPKPEGVDAEQPHQNQEKEPEEKTGGSRVSTPEDMTAEFLQLREESEREEKEEQTVDAEKQKHIEAGNETNIEGLSKQMSNEYTDTTGEDTAGCPGKRGDNEGQERSSESAYVDLQMEFEDQPGTSGKPPKAVGFPLSLTPKTDDTVQQDLTPTEYTLLDGALRNSPPSRSSPEKPAPVSPDEETMEHTSPDSRPNSAGHTPYCLSPDDVWCNRETLSRLQAQSESTGVTRTNGSSRQSEGQPCSPRGGPDNHTNPREKHLSFLSLGPLKDAASDPSPSLATTTTTHSMPAEVSSPQSTEVDESLSMSFEQGPTGVSQREAEDSVLLSHSNGSHCVGMSLPMKKPLRSLGQGLEMGRPPAPNSLYFEASAHDVDLCLVSPCEFKHFKLPDSTSVASEHSRGDFGPQFQGNSYHRDASPSESNAPVCMEDCPSTTAEGVLDSDEDDSCSEPTNSPRNLISQALPKDPLPTPLRDSPPLPPHPDASMPVPQVDSNVLEKRVTTSGLRGKTTHGLTADSTQRPGSGKGKTGNQSGVKKGKKDSGAHTSSSSPRSAPAKSSSDPVCEDVSVFVDLAYIPSGASSPTISVDFFKCVRSSCYIISGDCVEREELMRHTLDALLDGKTSWPDLMQVTVIPTFESVSMQDWYQQTLERQKELGIVVLGSNSTVAMQDETFPACKIEF